MHEIRNPIPTYSSSFLGLLLALVVMDLNLAKIYFPEQAVQFLFVTPVAIENQRDNTQQ